MAYFIPKSARTVKMEIFKGLSLVDTLVASTGFIAAFLVMRSGVPFLIGVIISVVCILISLFLALPSPIIPTQKSYQTLKTVYTYLSSSKNYKKGVRKNGKE